jgi:hypothetical protein
MEIYQRVSKTFRFFSKRHTYSLPDYHLIWRLGHYTAPYYQRSINFPVLVQWVKYLPKGCSHRDSVPYSVPRSYPLLLSFLDPDTLNFLQIRPFLQNRYRYQVNTYLIISLTEVYFFPLVTSSIYLPLWKLFISNVEKLFLLTIVRCVGSGSGSESLDTNPRIQTRKNLTDLEHCRLMAYGIGVKQMKCETDK